MTWQDNKNVKPQIYVEVLLVWMAYNWQSRVNCNNVVAGSLGLGLKSEPVV